MAERFLASTASQCPGTALWLQFQRGFQHEDDGCERYCGGFTEKVMVYAPGSGDPEKLLRVKTLKYRNYSMIRNAHCSLSATVLGDLL